MLSSGKEGNKVTDVGNVPTALTQKHPSFHHLPSFKATYHIWKSEVGLDGRATFMLGGDSNNHSGGWREATAAHLSNCGAGVRRPAQEDRTLQSGRTWGISPETAGSIPENQSSRNGAFELICEVAHQRLSFFSPHLYTERPPRL